MWNHYGGRVSRHQASGVTWRRVKRVVVIAVRVEKINSRLQRQDEQQNPPLLLTHNSYNYTVASTSWFSCRR
ncbi:hypothetical protein [Chlorogloeopsis sp. ULAP02]|uniref:hypothetical protein n=1 Tax=Chlorogloeopsis sp. ULAP02 TaxID=3107926 RepID=UPI00313540FB